MSPASDTAASDASAGSVMAPSLPRALFWIGLVMIGFPGINATIREITQQMHPFVVVFWRNLFAVALILPFVLARHGRNTFRLKAPKLVVARGALEFTAMCGVFMALKGLTLAQATALMFTQPIWITVGAALFLGETVRARRWIATFAGFIGMLVIVRPGFGDMSIYTLAALFSAVTGAASALMLRRVSQYDSVGKIICWMSMVVTPLSLTLAIPYWQPITWPLAGMILLAVLFGTLGHYSLTQSYRYGEASQLAPYRYGELVMAVLIGWLVFGELPSLYTYIGGAIIAGAGIYIAHREHVAARRSLQPVTEALARETL